jgi:hypothetical protein
LWKSVPRERQKQSKQRRHARGLGEETGCAEQHPAIAIRGIVLSGMTILTAHSVASKLNQ